MFVPPIIKVAYSILGMKLNNFNRFLLVIPNTFIINYPKSKCSR